MVDVAERISLKWSYQNDIIIAIEKFQIVKKYVISFLNHCHNITPLIKFVPKQYL